MTVTIEYFTGPVPLEEFETLRERINLQVKTLLEKNEIEFAGVINTVVITSDIKET